jgi:hypothetical protein
MFQNEMPYDPPNQASWRQDDVRLAVAKANLKFAASPGVGNG